jgi:ATP-binding cassette subfamily C protein CydC
MNLTLRLTRFLVPLRRRIALAILLGFATVIADLGLTATASYLISAAALKPLLIELSTVIFLVRFIGVSRAFLRYGERRASHDVTFRLLATLRGWFYRRVEPLAPASLSGYRSGDLLTRIVADIDELQNLYQLIVAPLLVAILTVSITIAAYFIFSPALALVAFLALATAGVGLPAFMHLLARADGRRMTELRAQLNVALIDGTQGAQDLLAFGRADDHRARIASIDRELARLERRTARISGLQIALHDVISGVGMVAILAVAIPLVRRGEMDGVYLATLALLVVVSLDAIKPIGRAFQFFGRSLAAGDRLFQIADSCPVIADPPYPISVPLNPLLEFEEVRFAYHPAGPPTLDGISFTLKPGGSVAIVGPSGSGKSTIVNLAVRFWAPASGQIRLGGCDTAEFALVALRDQVAVVSQDTHLYNNTIRANLMLAKPTASDQEIADVLATVRLEDFVRRQPKGLDSWIGEQGLLISGGERQRLAIARALLKDAPLLILDEATANLDPITEREVLSVLKDLMRGRTTLVITHRLIHMESFDEILVLDHGRIVQRGTHEELCSESGFYRQMLVSQDQMLNAE